MTETELINKIKELEELRTDLIHYGHRIKVDRSIIRYYLSEKQRNILLELVMKEERNLAHPTLLQAIRIWWNSRKGNEA